MAVNRSTRLERRRLDAVETKATNRRAKTKERARRDERMVRKLRAGSLPYTPEVMSWVSAKLDKRSGQLTQDDIARLLRERSPAG